MELTKENLQTEIQDGKHVRIRDVEFSNVEINKSLGTLVYIARMGLNNKIKLIVYPNDNFVELHKKYDVVANRCSDKNDGLIVLGQIYQELKVNDEIKVKLSKLGRRGEFSFMLYNYLGFLKHWGGSLNYKDLAIGDYVLARVKAIQMGSSFKNNLKKNFVHAIPLEKLVVNPVEI